MQTVDMLISFTGLFLNAIAGVWALNWSRKFFDKLKPHLSGYEIENNSNQRNRAKKQILGFWIVLFLTLSIYWGVEEFKMRKMEEYVTQYFKNNIQIGKTDASEEEIITSLMMNLDYSRADSRAVITRMVRELKLIPNHKDVWNNSNTKYNITLYRL